MKKVSLFLVLSAAIAMLLTAPVHALSLPVGPVKAHFTDYTSLFRNGVPLAITDPLAIGDEGRALAYVDSFGPVVGGIPYWVPSTTEEMTVLEYDFVLIGIIPTGPASFTLDFGPGPRFGGLIDMWLDTTPDWATGGLLGGPVPNQGPGAWATGVHAGHDDYPGGSDSATPGAGGPVAIDPAVSL